MALAENVEAFGKAMNTKEGKDVIQKYGPLLVLATFLIVFIGQAFGFVDATNIPGGENTLTVLSGLIAWWVRGQGQ